MSLASLIGIDRERYDAGNKFLSQDRFLANYNPRDPITFNVSPNINTGIMGPRVYPYPPIVLPGDGDDGGNINLRGKDYGYTSLYDQSKTVQGPQTKEEFENYLNDIGVGTITKEEEDFAKAEALKQGLVNISKAALFGPLQYVALSGVKKGIDFGINKAKDFFDDDGDQTGPDITPGTFTVESIDDYFKGEEGPTTTSSTTTMGRAPESYEDLQYGGRVGYSNGGASLNDAKMMAPKGEFLAYINPKEAQMLKNAGGSGVMTPMGIPSFTEDEEDTGEVANPGSVNNQSVTADDGFAGEEGPRPTYAAQYKQMTKPGGGDGTTPPTFKDNTPILSNLDFKFVNDLDPAFTYASNYGKLGGILDLNRTLLEEEPVGSIGYTDPFGNFTLGYNTDLGKVATGRLGNLNVGYTDLSGRPTVDYTGAFANDAGRFSVGYNTEPYVNLSYVKQFNNGGIVGLYK